MRRLLAVGGLAVLTAGCASMNGTYGRHSDVAPRMTDRTEIEGMLVDLLLFLSDKKVKDFDGKPIYLIFCRAGDDSDDPDGSLNAEQLQKSLEALANQTGDRNLIRTFRDEVKVAPLHLLLHNMHKACVGDKPLPFFQSALTLER